MSYLLSSVIILIVGLILAFGLFIPQYKLMNEMTKICEDKNGTYMGNGNFNQCYIFENGTLVEYKMIKIKDNIYLYGSGK